MRYIEPPQFQLSDGWPNRAAKAAEAVAKGASPDKFASVWQELKDDLAKHFHNKCWYCETVVERSDNAVDHFRPKGRVSDASRKHDGYRWLAFELSNFRYACTYCNSQRKSEGYGTEGGKSDKFPLLNEDQRVYAKASIALERPVLLDPCEIGDWKLLGCKKENGRPCASSENPEQKKRAEVSIEIYHLHYEPTCKRRYSSIAKLLNDIRDAKLLYDATMADAEQSDNFKNAARRILAAIRPHSEFSGDMRFILGGERDHDHPWIQSFLEA